VFAQSIVGRRWRRPVCAFHGQAFNQRDQAISELPLASSSKRFLVLILSYENEISFTYKLNSFSNQMMSTKTRFEEEAKGKPIAICVTNQ